MRLALALLVSSVLAGCSTNSGVLKTGPNSFTITTSASAGRGGLAAAKAMAYQQANEVCTQQAREIKVQQETAEDISFTRGLARVDLTFACRPR